MDDETAEKTGPDNGLEQRADKLKGGAEARIRIGGVLLPSAVCRVQQLTTNLGT
jgi:hypothetical protein